MKLKTGLLLLAVSGTLAAAGQKDTAYYKVGLQNADNKVFQVSLKMPVHQQPLVDLRMPSWTPGYYQLMNYGNNVAGFQVKDEKGNTLSWQKMGSDTWRIAAANARQLQVQYEVKAERAFIANPYIDQERAFIRPTGVFLYVDNKLHLPVIVDMPLANGWNRIATGLDSIGIDRYLATDFDVLFDSPILVGNLQELPSFKVDGKPHRFLGYKMGELDGASLMRDIEKIVKTASGIIGDMPYKHYTIMGIGPGNGGIEQLNSTAISFTGAGLDNPSSRLRMLSFIAHEYFHHYNVKRIRPIELDPFDYSRPNRTTGLWVGEGLTVYYESQILNRAGLMTGKQVLEGWQNTIQGYENNPGRKKQTLAQSSFNTWEDGPFGKRGETISFYEKGPIIGLLLDIVIRDATANKKSLDDAMRELYYTYNIKEKRGFTEAEVKAVCEKAAGKKLDEIFSYIYTLSEIDYKRYFAIAGITFNIERDADDKAKVLMGIAPSLTPLQKSIQAGLMKGL